MCNVFDFVNDHDQSFDQIKVKCGNVPGLVVRETSDLYLLANVPENETKNKKFQKTRKSNDAQNRDVEVRNDDVEVRNDDAQNRDVEVQNEVEVRNGEVQNGEVQNGDVQNDINVSLLQKQANGIIFEKGTNKVVAMCQNKLEDIYDYNEAGMLIMDNYNKGNDVRVEYCEDGTLIRLYYHRDTWNVATTRCIDAKRSFWSSNKSFDSMFWEIFDKTLIESLDENFTYLFILLHKENRIVVRHKLNMLVYISRIHNTTFVEDHTNQFRNIYGIKRPKLINLEDLDFRTMFNPYKRGILIKICDKETGLWTFYKLDFENYRLVKRIRGNVPEIRMRFLELLSDPEGLALLERFYSEYHFMFIIIKSDLMKLVKSIHKLYIESHVKHSITVTEENQFFRTLKQLHAHYKTSQKPITFDEVRQKLFSMDKYVIKRFLAWS